MIVLVTGASSGLGEGLARAYLARGDQVVALARRVAGLQALAAQVPNLTVRTVDVTDRAAVEAAILDAETTVGPIDLGIACAGIAEQQDGPDLDLAALAAMIQTNTIGSLNALVPLAREMRLRGTGQIAAVSSIAALLGIPALAGYAASKAALDTAVQAMRLMLLGSGVTVTLVSPGFVTTPMTESRVDPRWCMPLDTAVRRIVAGLDARRTRIRLSSGLAAGLRVIALLPDPVQAAVLARLMDAITPKPAAGASRAPAERVR